MCEGVQLFIKDDESLHLAATIFGKNAYIDDK
jgi:hypothetical protein